MSTFFRPVSNASLKAAALAPLGASGFALPVVNTADIWQFVSGAVSDTGASAIVSGYGFSCATSDVSGNVYAAQYSGSVVMLNTGGAVSATYPLPSGHVFEGMAYVSGYGAPYLSSTDGNLWTLISGAISGVTPAFGATLAKTLHVSGNTLFSLSPPTSAVLYHSLASAVSGVSGAITAPLYAVSCLAVSAAGIAVGGWDQASLVSGFTVLAADPNVSTNLVAISSTSGTASLITSDALGNWSISQTLSGVTSGQYATWEPAGNYIFVGAPTVSSLYVLQYSVGTLSLSQTLTISGSAASTFTPDSVYGLNCQPAANKITALTFSGSWAPSGTITIGNPQSVVGVSSTQAAAGCVSGLAYLYLTGGSWAVSGTVSLPYIPTALACDPEGNVYAAGASGANGYFSVISGLSVASSATWTGAAAGLVYLNGQVVVGDPTNDLLRLFGPVSGVWGQRSSVSAPSGAVSLAFNGDTLFATGISGTGEWNFTSPYHVSPARLGAVAVYASGSWTTASLGVGQQPTAAAWNPSGQVSVATLGNTLYSISVTGGVIASGAIAQSPNQPQSTPIGLSYLRWLGTSLYGSTSLNDSLVQIE